jgi:hypothetical protein
MFLHGVVQLSVIVNFAPSSAFLFILMILEKVSSELSTLIRVTRRRIPEEGILHRHRHEYLKSYIELTSRAL